MSRKQESELLVITKMYELIVWSANHIVKFLRAHRFTLGDRLAVRLYGLLDALIRAKYTRDRLPVLREVNLGLELLRFQFRLAKDLKCLSIESYGSATRFTNEVGQLAGMWAKRAAGRPEGATS